MPDDGQQKEKRRDEAAKHARPILAQTLAVLEQLLTFALEFFGDVKGVVRVEGPVNPRDINRRHQNRNWAKLETGGDEKENTQKAQNEIN